MKRAILVCAISCGFVLTLAGPAAGEEAAPEKDEELIVLFVKVIEESVDKRKSQVLSQPTLTTILGRPVSMAIGGQIPIGTAYYDTGYRFDILPSKISGQTVWLEIETTFSNYSKDAQGEMQPSTKRQVTKRKLKFGDMFFDDSLRWNLHPKSQMRIAYRIERMTEKEYAIADAKAREAAR